MLRCVALIVVLLLFSTPMVAQTTYQKAPKAIADVLDAPIQPQALLSPTRDFALLVQSERYPSIADLSEPMLRLAGLRINPANNGPHAPPRVVGLTLLELDGAKRTKIDVPEGSRLGVPVWSPDGKRFAFTRSTADVIELWLGEVATAKATVVPGVKLNAVLAVPFHWMPGSGQLVCVGVPDDRGKVPEASRVPTGPVIQESDGKKAPARTHQDLLQTDYDETLFEFFGTSKLGLFDIAANRYATFEAKGMYASVHPSPDGKYLLVTRIHRPFSRLHTVPAFPREIEVWETGSGKVIAKIANLPLADKVPIEGVPTGPRDVHWIPTEDSTLIWVEALDGGDPKAKVSHRDQLLTRAITSTPVITFKPPLFAKTEHRYAGVSFTEKGGIALLSDYERGRKRRRTYLIDLAKPDGERKLLWDLSINEKYNHPGTPFMHTLPNGHAVLWTHEGKLFLHGQGSSPEGDRPFLDEFDPKTGKSRRLFHCEQGVFETPIALLSLDGQRFLTRRESPTVPPNIYARTTAGKSLALTDFKDPTPQIRGITKKLVTYKRADGVPLSFTLYLPPGYKEGQRLPAFVWAYPREFTDADTAGQVAGSPYHFTTLSGPSHLFLVLQGYAVLVR